METTVRGTFAALSVRNFRLFMTGQGISLCGTWMQTVGLSWLVLKLTGSGTKLGLVVAAQFLPILLFGLLGGVVADSFNKRRVLYGTQSAAGLLALGMGLLVVTGVVQLWMVYLFAVGLGLVQCVDTPTRQAFVVEMVGKRYLKNAVTLNSTMVNAARVIGPSIAGVLIATVGIGQCFIVNAATYLAVLIALVMMREKELHRTPPSPREPGQVRAGLRYVWGVPRLKGTLIMMFIVGTFAFELPVVLPLFATVTMHGGAGTYSIMMAATGFGAIFSGLYTAGKTEIGDRQLIRTVLFLGVSMLVLSVVPDMATALLVLVAVGVLTIMFAAIGNTTLQIASDPAMRGRVMALWAIGFLGTTPIGGPIIGFVSDHANPRVGLAVGGLSAVIAAAIGLRVYRNGLDTGSATESGA